MAYTSPYMEDTEDILAEVHGQRVYARATHSSFTGAIDLDVEGGFLTWDESTAPRVQGSLICRVPDDQDTLDMLDPRLGVRVEIDCGYVRPGGEEDVHTIVDLGLRDRQVNRPDNTMTLRLASDEALVIDGSPTFAQTVTGTYAPDAMIKLIKQVIVPYPKIHNTVDITESPDSISIDPVTDRWTTINDLADTLELDVYDNGLRDWYIHARPTVVGGTSAAILRVGANGTIIRSETGLSRDPWFNYVAINYEWLNSSNAIQRVKTTAYASSGSYQITGDSGKKIYFEEREVPTSQAKANRASAALLRRFLSRGRSMSVEAISTYWLRPGMSVTVQLPEGPQERHLVSRVDFDLGRGTMNVETRVPDTTTAISTTTPTTTPSSDPTPTAVTKYVTTWTANNSQSYEGDGTQRSFATTNIIQGVAPYGGYGNERGLALFTASNSTGDETGKSITTALSGATISKVEVYLYAEHWYYNSGGTARIGYYNGTSIPTTLSPSPYITSRDWPKPGGRWVNITSSALKSALLAGTARGVTVGPGSSSSYLYYGRFRGHSETNPPKLRITYSK